MHCMQLNIRFDSLAGESNRIFHTNKLKNGYKTSFFTILSEFDTAYFALIHF